jgi:hypothetical protein
LITGLIAARRAAGPPGLRRRPPGGVAGERADEVMPAGPQAGACRVQAVAARRRWVQEQTGADVTCHGTSAPDLFAWRTWPFLREVVNSPAFGVPACLQPYVGAAVS